jgi:hypothetical protein
MTSRACTPPSCSWEQRSLPSNGASASARLSLSIPRSELSHISVEWLPLRIFLSNDFQRKSPGDKILFGMRRIKKSVGDLSENHFSVSIGLDFGSRSFLRSELSHIHCLTFRCRLGLLMLIQRAKIWIAVSSKLQTSHGKRSLSSARACSISRTQR